MAKQSKKTRPQMREGETLVWTGNPVEEKDCGRIDLFLLPFSALLLAVSAAFATMMVFSILRDGFAPRHLAEFILLLCVGGFAVYSYFLRFAVKRRAKADLAYGVTSCGRVLIRDSAAPKPFIFEAKQLRDAYVSEVDSHGIGTIYLQRKGPGHLLDNTGLDFLGLRSGAHIALYDVADCEKVLKLIKGRRR